MRYANPLLPVVSLLAFLAFIVAAPEVQAAEDIGLDVPEGFEVTLYADDDLAHDVFSLTFDAKGRAVVSGPGYVRILLDLDRDGKADAFQQFADGPATGAQGMYFYGNDLFCSGDEGLIRYRDQNRDDKADGPPDLFLRLRTGGEHNAHAIRRGPDGWWYLIAGNTTEVTAGYITSPTSPVKYPAAGTLMRLKPDLSGGEVFAHGIRNAYDFDFHPLGNLFSFDSDGERDVSLPWYRPSRVFQLPAAAHTGWVSRSWKRPDDFYDMPPVIASFGRGSPTGVVCYRHTQFPEIYQSGLFVLDWTFGRVLAVPLVRDGETFQSKPHDFVTAHGEFGFAPTDAEIGPDGSLYVSVGGRGTRGGVYRVTYVGQETAEAKAADPPISDDPTEAQLLACLDAPQPLSSWSRRQWEPVARQLGVLPFTKFALLETASEARRVRAIEIMTEVFNGIPFDSIEKLAGSQSAVVRARTAWSLERHLPEGFQPAILHAMLTDADPFVRHSALQTFSTHAAKLTVPLPQIALLKCLADSRQRVRFAAARAVAALDEASFQKMGVAVRGGDWWAALTYAEAKQIRDHKGEPVLNAYAIEMGRIILEDKHPLELKREAVRLIQLGLGDVGGGQNLPPAYDGYASPLDLGKFERELDPLRVTVAASFPTGDARFDHELMRLAAMLTPYNAELLGNVLAGITAESDPIDDIHRLIVASRIPVVRSRPQQELIAHALVQIDPKLAARKYHRDTNWEDRISEMYGKLVEIDPDLPAYLLQEKDFGRPSHVLFLSKFPSELIPDAITRFAEATAADPDYAWNNDVVFLFGLIESDTNREIIRKEYDRFAVRNAVMVTLSDHPDEIDRPKFVEGLDSSQPEVLTAALKGLEQLSPTKDANEFAVLVRTLRRLGNDKAEFPIRDRVAELLQKSSGQNFGYVIGTDGQAPQTEAIKGWTEWVTKTYPETASMLLGGSESELADLKALLATVDWKKGDSERGRKLFTSRACSQCHGGSRSLGPDLAGVAGRFSREDLFIAITLPNRDVSPRYQTTVIETTKGKVFSGLIIYESVDGVTLRNGTNQTFRIEGPDIESRRKQNSSLMPGGLLKDLAPADLADLYAYLQGLSTQTAARLDETQSE